MTQIPPMQPPMPPQQGYPTGYGQPPKSQGLAITSMILGILSIVTFCIVYLSIPLGLTAVILALVARPKIARGEAGGRGMATAGLITGAIGLLLAIAILIAGAVFGTKLVNWAEQQQQKAIQQQQQMQQQDQSTTTTETTETTEDAGATTTDDQQDTAEPATPEGTK